MTIEFKHLMRHDHPYYVKFRAAQQTNFFIWKHILQYGLPENDK